MSACRDGGVCVDGSGAQGASDGVVWSGVHNRSPGRPWVAQDEVTNQGSPRKGSCSSEPPLVLARTPGAPSKINGAA
jgi:hypothetical protein